jgi:hypothetical protein
MKDDDEIYNFILNSVVEDNPDYNVTEIEKA